MRLTYWLRSLLCAVRGHRWIEHSNYEDVDGYPFRLGGWRECPRCERYEGT